jgi:hypothetical protein
MEVESKAEYYTPPVPNAHLSGSCIAIGSRQETFIESPLVHTGFLIFDSELVESA